MVKSKFIIMTINQLLRKSLTNLAKPIMLLAVLVFVSTANAVFAQNWDQIIKVVASDRAADDEFGRSVAISGDYAIVGAALECHNATGGDSLYRAGSAYIFKNNAGTWTQMQKIVASDRGATDMFGITVAISGDYAIVGANGEDEDATGGNTLSLSGSAYIFKNIAGTWSQVQKIVASDRATNDLFGGSVSISGDYAIVGASNEDHDASGGNTLNLSGSAYIFKNIAGTWSQVQKIVASDRGASDYFGNSVAISGDNAIVGAFQEDHDITGGNTLSNAGSAYIFKNTLGTWSQVQKIVASDRGGEDRFGYSVAISGDHAIVGAILEDNDAVGGNPASNSGSAYIFKNTAGTWSQLQKIVASDRETQDEFGFSVAISGDHAIVGAHFEDHNATGGNTLLGAGSAYIFKNTTGTWSQVQKIVASDRWTYDEFGRSVAISGDYALVSAFREDENATGGNTLSDAGSAYIFKNCTKSGTDIQSACDSFTWIDGITYTTSNNTATFTIAGGAANDCDSVVTLNLTIHYSNTATDVQTACNSYTWIDGNTYTTSNNTATDTLINADGCDSVVTLNLTIHYSNTGTDVQTACNSYTWLDGNTYSTSNNTATDTLINADGCDSVVTLNLTIHYSNTGTDVQTGCNSFTWIDGNTYTTSTTTATDTLTNAAGCDSVVTLHLTINSVSDLSTTTSGLAISANNANATYQWLDCNNAYAIINGQTGQTFTATANGNYAVELTENGCVDTSACVAITTVGIVENSFGDGLFIYPNPTKGNFSIDLGALYENAQVSITDISGKLVESKSIAQSQVLNLTIEEPAGIYLISIQAGNKKAVIKLVKE
jgi:hypothetical protein